MLREVLTNSPVGQPQTPIEVGQWYVIAQLEQIVPAQLDGALAQKLLNELFQSWLDEQVRLVDFLLPQETSTVVKLADPQQDLALITQEELDTLVAYLHKSRGLNIRDRNYKLKLYPQCFVGEEAVRWFMNAYGLTEAAAVLLGQRLVELQVIHHVLDAHVFKNSYMFYRFYADEGTELGQTLSLGTAELASLVEHMRGPRGLDISDRQYRLKTYPQCFVGQEAVAWLMSQYELSQEAAVRVGQTLIERGIIHHVTDDHAFKDEYLFYRFYEDEPPTPDF
ncbi:MAG: hypothetical protein HC890_07730 [Chloroflexaceae bacterium]|nr:hypothetical protein [Chloroflexaceae bacterium]